ncbi:hypothetical protein JB92DRAFT_2911109 [Gautieria morchelliformis]|nr:hypothetical protein JB92DRAFT_2911109 [Gautieria morchelliformis]
MGSTFQPYACATGPIPHPHRPRRGRVHQGTRRLSATPQQCLAEPSHRLHAVQPPTEHYSQKSRSAGHTEGHGRVKIYPSLHATTRLETPSLSIRKCRRRSHPTRTCLMRSCLVMTSPTRKSPVRSSPMRTTRRSLRRTPQTGSTASRSPPPHYTQLAPPVARRRFNLEPVHTAACRAEYAKSRLIIACAYLARHTSSVKGRDPTM